MPRTRKPPPKPGRTSIGGGSPPPRPSGAGKHQLPAKPPPKTVKTPPAPISKGAGGPKPPQTAGGTPMAPAPKPASAKRRGPNLNRLAKSPNKQVARKAKNAIAARTLAKAGANRAGFGTKSNATKRTIVTNEDGTTKVVRDIPDGKIGYAGRTYDAKNLEGLARELGRRGVSVKQFFQNNPKAAQRLGLGPKAIGQFAAARKATSAARKTAKAARARKRVK